MTFSLHSLLHIILSVHIPQINAWNFVLCVTNIRYYVFVSRYIFESEVWKHEKNKLIEKNSQQPRVCIRLSNDNPFTEHDQLLMEMLLKQLNSSLWYGWKVQEYNMWKKKLAFYNPWVSNTYVNKIFTDFSKTIRSWFQLELKGWGRAWVFSTFRGERIRKLFLKFHIYAYSFLFI